MKKLIIIGNGFDLSHDLETRYYDLKKWMLEYLELPHCPTNKYLTVEDLISPAILNRSFGDKGVADRMTYIFIDEVCKEENEIDSEWGSLEEKLSQIDFVKWYYEAYQKKDFFKEKGRDWDNVEEELKCSFMYLEDLLICYLKEWVNSIDVSNVKEKSKFVDILDIDTYILDFNYTQLIKGLYGSYIDLEKVCYVHITNEKNEVKKNYILGTNFNYGNNEIINYMPVFNNWFEERFTKNVRDIIKSNNTFFW